ncbi:MAG TPA: hypothetical protein PLE99_10605 [Candidatus Thiothrix moscowensis]|uniref:hypothetical protein n=1 Tax=unclassified Thiothrix TaxID=2636184 RepID=UPI001A1C91C9|nr:MULTISPECIES: hypothetical protein [unclassified Thiothrix]MBJ6611386.1 hypothetical protein [Candidatus Thiothrix moscowensis]HRJ53209.1 hypothetical protein [Candidatus Thiothrix moscowensis]HRJ93221.1 hypothetical protein [Candidatus Thiothrix moscowensis]
MKKPYYLLLAIGLGCFAGQALAVSCEVEYNAKRVNRDRYWYGSVERPEFKSGTAKGTGSDIKACEKDAVASIEKDGWQVTSYKSR